MSKVLFIRSTSISPRVEKEAASLAKEGYVVSLFLWNRFSNALKHKVKNGCNIYEFGLKAPVGKYRLVFYWMIWWSAIFVYLMKKRFDTVHVCGLDSYPPAILGKIIKRNIIIYDIFDFFGQTLPPKTPRIIAKFICNLERILLRFADVVIIVDECRRIQLEGAKIHKLEIIMNCTSDDYRLNIYKKNDAFTIFYGGMISKDRGLNQLIDVIKNEEDIKLIVAGTGEDEAEFKGIFNSCSNIEFLGHVNHDEAIRLTYQANVVFGFYDPIIPNNRLASPNKLFEAMMCRTPIVVNEETSMAEIVRKENCGLSVPYDDKLALKKTILKLKNNPELCRKMGENGRKAFEREYNWEIMEERLIALYHKVSNEGTPSHFMPRNFHDPKGHP